MIFENKLEKRKENRLNIHGPQKTQHYNYFQPHILRIYWIFIKDVVIETNMANAYRRQYPKNLLKDFLNSISDQKTRIKNIEKLN